MSSEALNVCPDIGVLLEKPRAFAAHLDECGACRGVSALIDLRHERIVGQDDACERGEVSIALLHEGFLSDEDQRSLVEHLERCSGCNETAARMMALPPIEITSPAQIEPEPTRRRGPWVGALVGFGVAAAIAAIVFGVSKREPPPPATAAREQLGPGDAPAVRPHPTSNAAGGVLALPVVPSVPKPPPAPSASPAKSDAAVAAQHGFLSLLCSPACTSVTVDKSRELGPSPVVRAKLSPGVHRLEVQGAGSRRTFSVVIVAGQTISRRVELGKSEPESGVLNPWNTPARPNPYASDSGFLTVVCSPACDSVTVQGKNIGPSPIVRHALPVGSYTVGLRWGSETEARAVSIKDGETSALRAQKPMDPGF